MRLPRFQVKIQTLMVTIAALGILGELGLVSGVSRQRSAHYRTLATGFATKEKAFASHAQAS